MNTFVCIKQVPDTETKIALNSDKNGIDTSAVKWVMNPYDEFAVEEALKFKADGGKVIVVSVGPKGRIVDSIRTALAMGADEGIAVDAPESLDAYATAKALASVIKQEGEFNQVFTGKLAIDNNNSAVTQMVAEFLEAPHAVVVSKLEAGDGSITVEREVEGGSKEIIELKGPSVVGANKGLNKPRYASLPGIMKAKKKPLKEVSLSDLGITDEDQKVVFKNYQLPPEKPPVQMIDGEPAAQAAELVKKLREEAKVI